LPRRMCPRFIHRRESRWWLWIILFPWAAGATPQAIEFSTLISEMSDLNSLPMPKPYQVQMISTYDREGMNQDAYNFFSKHGERAVLARFSGPGVITRIYAATPGGILRIYLDEQEEPLIDMKAKDFFAGSIEPFLKPLVGESGGGHYSYFPIPFSRSARLELGFLAPQGDRGDKGFGAYWQVSCRRYPAETIVKSLELPLESKARTQLISALEFFSKKRFLPDSSSFLSDEKTPELAPGETELVFSQKGPGIIRMLSVVSRGTGDWRPSPLRVRIFWDDESEPSVDCPLQAFFGNGWGPESPQGILERLPAGGRSIFPMPFEKARIILVNDGPYSSGPLQFQALYELGETETDLRLHAWYHQEMTRAYPAVPNRTGEHNYIVLKTKGQGHYVGTVLHVYNHYHVWWGEGDEMIFLDREPYPPSFHGTGCEEYFDSGWCKFGLSPFAGAPLANSLGKGYAGKTILYRFHVADPIPFNREIEFSMEHGRVTNDLDNLYASVAYWYQREPHHSLDDPPPFAERALDERALAKNVRKQEWSRTPVFLKALYVIAIVLILLFFAAGILILIRLKSRARRD
jgi:hypothetical protein